MTDQQLQLALAKMLPKELKISAGKSFVMWNKYVPNATELDLMVLETEWLHICWLAAHTLSDFDISNYAMELRKIVVEKYKDSYKSVSNPIPDGLFYEASWQQRAEALCKVKGITL